VRVQSNKQMTTECKKKMSTVLFKDEAHHGLHVQMQQPARFQITDCATVLAYSAVNAQHGCRIIEALTGRAVSQSMFYCLVSKAGARAGALRRRFRIERAQ